MPKISVIIPAYNCAPYLSEAIESILSQTFIDYEIVIVDDGSTDATATIAHGYCAKHPQRCKYIYQNNQGPSAARNNGIQNSCGEYVAFLDGDDIWLPGKLEAQVKAISKSESIGMVTSARITITQDGDVFGSPYFYNLINKRKLMQDLHIKNVIGGGSSVLIRRSCFTDVGYFDENLLVAEDWDLWLRISEKYDVVFINEPLLKLRIREGSQSHFGERNLKYDLICLSRAYAKAPWKWRFYLKSRAFSYRYFCAAWASLEAKNHSSAKKLITKALIGNPFYFFTSRECCGLLTRIYLGDKLFVGIRKSFKFS